MFQRLLSVVAIALVQIGMANLASATIVYSDNFDTNTSANYNVFVTAGATGPSGDATFAYNYGAAPAGGLSIPSPTPGGTTLGLRVRTDNLQSSVGTIVGATEVVTKNLVLPSVYTVSVNVWSNYIGSGTSIATSGTNGSTGVAVGIGTKGNAIQYIAGNDGMLVEGFGDNGGGANGAYRVYTDNVSPRPTPANSPYYAAGTGANSATNTDSYYTFTGGVPAPLDQKNFSATQGGTSTVGTLGFAWHTFLIENNGTNVKWFIDNHLITTVPLSAMTFGGSQVSLGNDDTNLTGSSAANNQLFNAEIFDNLTIIDTVPEASAGLFGVLICGILGLAAVVRKFWPHAVS